MPERKSQNQTEDKSKEVAQKDSKPASSNTERKTQGSSSTEVNSADSTSTIQSTPAMQSSTLSPSSEEKFQILGEKLDNHVENLEKYKEATKKKLKEAIEKESTPDELEDIKNHFKFVPTFHKRHSQQITEIDPHFTNSVW